MSILILFSEYYNSYNNNFDQNLLLFISKRVIYFIRILLIKILIKWKFFNLKFFIFFNKWKKLHSRFVYTFHTRFFFTFYLGISKCRGLKLI